MLSKEYTAARSNLQLDATSLVQRPTSNVYSSTEDNTAGVNSRNFDGKSPNAESKHIDSSFGFQVGHSVDNNSV